MKRQVKLTRQEVAVEKALLKGEYVDVKRSELEEIASAIVARKKDAVLNIRVNSQDLKRLKEKAKKLGIKYQTFIAELLHRVAHS